MWVRQWYSRGCNHERDERDEWGKVRALWSGLYDGQGDVYACDEDWLACASLSRKAVAGRESLDGNIDPGSTTRIADDKRDRLSSLYISQPSIIDLVRDLFDDATEATTNPT